MARARIHRSYNLPERLIAEAESRGLDAISTGGGMDYIYKALGKNSDGSDKVAILAASRESGSPDTLGERSDVIVMFNENWTDQVAIPFRTAREAMDVMAKMYDPMVP